jgi:hypothetical protein
MPRPGVPNNPGGANGADDPKTGTTSVAGVVHRQMGLTSAAPIPPVPGLNAPKQAGRTAKRGAQSAPTPVAQPAPAAPPAPLPYNVRLAQAWAQVASIPGSSPLVQQLAQEAQGG